MSDLKSLVSASTSMNCFSGNGYKSKSLVQLFADIITGDQIALNELHSRFIFENGNARLTIVGFINLLADSRIKGLEKSGDDLDDIEFAQDLTADKFFLLPIGELKRKSIDCRLYYQAIMNELDRLRSVNSSSNCLVLEEKAIKLLRGMLVKHFTLSMYEAYRTNDKHFSRYNWTVKGKILRLKMPVSIVGRDRHKWLFENIIKKPNFDRSLEKERVQEFIYKCFGGRKRGYSYNDSLAVEQELTFDQVDDSPRLDLGKAVALEKCDSIKDQRPSIRHLGFEKLQILIERIFSDIEDGCFDDSKIAADFNLSKSTFSRFAGSKWLRNSSHNMPDLWKNTAAVVMSYPSFRNAAQSSRLFEFNH